MLGYKSKESAYRMVEKLVENKYLYKDHTGKIIIRDNKIGKLKMLGYVEAGFRLQPRSSLSVISLSMIM